MTTETAVVRDPSEITRRRTLAIISHPDAGKTTLTEKLLLYGGAIHLAGSVKQRKAERQTTSDWMELEQQRGISISTSVLQFDYEGWRVNLLDTPGHNDFSEDTYRTLAAADSAIMLIDRVKGVEPQTIKLFKVCRMRGIPILTFVNKMDRNGLEPLELLDEIERVLDIPCYPMNWPVGTGVSFQGVYDRQQKCVLRFERGGGGSTRIPVESVDLEDPTIAQAIGDASVAQIREELEILEGASEEWDAERFMAGQLTPVFFGSALSNFGVEPFLHQLVRLASPPRPRPTTEGHWPADARPFSAFVFKIQANMDPRHRDRIAFARICSGFYHPELTVTHQRTGKPLPLSKVYHFMARERIQVKEAYSGDVVGLWDPGVLRIGDTLFEDTPVEFDGIPRFSPEHFVRIRYADAMRRKQLLDGLEQLAEEGAVQIFHDRRRLERFPILGAVGVLQFEVTQFRLKSEYGAEVQFEPLPYLFARWIEGDVSLEELCARGESTWVYDIEEHPLVLFKTEWTMRRAQEAFPKVKFLAAVQPGRSARAQRR